jgi:hypothetical protein
MRLIHRPTYTGMRNKENITYVSKPVPKNMTTGMIAVIPMLPVKLRQGSRARRRGSGGSRGEMDERRDAKRER